LQKLGGRGRAGAEILLRLDNSLEAAEAPYQFDAAAGRFHCRGCAAIPAGAPLYALWHLGRDDLSVACKRCRPLPDETKPSEPTDRADLLLGLVSLVSQFSSVLKERGKDYQKTDEGQVLSEQLSSLYHGLGRKEKDLLDTALVVLDGMVEKIRSLDRAMGKNGTEGKE
jgi:hypothetical protein